MKKGQDLRKLTNVEKVTFRQSAKISIRTWKIFDEGRALFPEDAAAELADRAGVLNKFTRQQIDRAWQQFDTWNGQNSSAAFRQSIENNSDLTSCETVVLSWEGLAVERNEGKLSQQLSEILNQVRYRRAIYPT